MKWLFSRLEPAFLRWTAQAFTITPSDDPYFLHLMKISNLDLKVTIDFLVERWNELVNKNASYLALRFLS